MWLRLNFQSSVWNFLPPSDPGAYQYTTSRWQCPSMSPGPASVLHHWSSHTLILHNWKLWLKQEKIRLTWLRSVRAWLLIFSFFFCLKNTRILHNYTPYLATKVFTTNNSLFLVDISRFKRVCDFLAETSNNLKCIFCAGMWTRWPLNNDPF